MDNKGAEPSDVQEQTEVADLSSEKSNEVAASVNQGETVLLTTAFASNNNGNAEPSELSSSSSNSVEGGTTNEATANPKASIRDVAKQHNESNTVAIDDTNKGAEDDVEADDKSEEEDTTESDKEAMQQLEDMLREINNGSLEQDKHVSKQDNVHYWEEEGSG